MYKKIFKITKIKFCIENEDGRINNSINKNNIIKLLFDKFGKKD